MSDGGLQNEIAWRDSELQRMHVRIQYLEDELQSTRMKSNQNWSISQRCRIALGKIIDSKSSDEYEYDHEDLRSLIAKMRKIAREALREN